MPDVIGTIGTGTHFPCNHKSGLFILYRDSTPLYAGLMFMGASSKLRACWVISILLCETLWPQQYICGWSPPLVKKPCLLLKSLALPSSIPEVLCFTTHCCWWNDSCRIVWCCLFTVWNMYQQNWAICGVSMSVNLSLEHSEYLNQPKIFNQRRQRLTALTPQGRKLWTKPWDDKVCTVTPLGPKVIVWPSKHGEFTVLLRITCLWSNHCGLTVKHGGWT